MLDRPNDDIKFTREIRPRDAGYSQPRSPSRHSDHLTTSEDPSTRSGKSSSNSRDMNANFSKAAYATRTAFFRSSRGRDQHRERSRDQHSEEEKPWPRRGKTRIPRKFLHVDAIFDIGYPFRQEVSKEVIINGRKRRSEMGAILTCE